MANLITVPVVAPPEHISIDVDFYDDDEKSALESSALAKDFKGLPRRISLPVADLCAYYLYYKFRPEVPGFSSHTEIAKKWHQALVEFDGQIGFGDSSFYALSLDNRSTGTTERLGEAVGLSVACKLHSFHQADWARIPIDKTKTLDFRRNVASDSLHFVEVENKGSIVAEIDKRSAVSNQKGGIKKKKAELRSNGDGRTIMYGTVAVIDDQPSSVAKCLLVDPPTFSLENPRRFKILARLQYIAELVSLLGGRSAFAASLQSRLAALFALPDISPLDGVPLVRGSGTEYIYAPYERFFGHNSWFSSKTVVSNGPVGGQLDLVSPDSMFFIGIREELVDFAARQDFENIESYKFESAMLEKMLDCTIPRGRFRSEFAPYLKIPGNTIRPERGYFKFRLPAFLYYTQSGLVFGTAAVPSDWKR